VKTCGAPQRLRITTGYLASDDSPAADLKVEQAVRSGLTQYADSNPTIVSSAKVGATVADDIKQSSALSLMLSVIAIFLYVLWRFEKWQYSLASIVALVHDALIVIVSFPIARFFGLTFEMDQVFVAAVLTVLGFSINDTVVIYDRIREYLVENPRLGFNQVVNPALNATLSRTIITALTVLGVVVVLYIFGGETLRSFSFAMIVGVIFGTYSSLFIAAPLILDTYGKKDARARAAAGEDLTAQPGDAPKLNTANA
jgi:SecD/SecF fusion protein